MPRKQILIAGASGLVGYAAIRHFGADPDCDVIAVSRRAPDKTHGARFLALDLTDAAACEQLAARLPGVTHLVYAALYERPGLVVGWRERQQIETNDRMFRNLFDPLQRHANKLRHVTLLQGTKAYGVHVRPLAVPARENRSEMHQQPNFYWNQENHLRASQRGKDWSWSILRPGADRRLFHRQRHERDPRPWRLCRPAARGRTGPALPRWCAARGASDRRRPVGPRHRLGR